MSLSLSLSIYISLSLYIYISIYLSIYIYIYMYIYICVTIFCKHMYIASAPSRSPQLRGYLAGPEMGTPTSHSIIYYISIIYYSIV